MNLKDKIGIIQAVVTIFAVLVGGLWSYNLFIKERKNYPHVNISQVIEHVHLTDEIILLRVNVAVKNSGTSRLILKKTKQTLQQILPILSCTGDEDCSAQQINDAL